MNYRELERKRTELIREPLFKDPGGGTFLKKNYPFVLKDANKNLWHRIRKDAIDYFKQNKIVWWPGSEHPTGHLLSSQVACVNHLFHLRKDHDAVLKILQNLNSDFVDAIPAFEEGFIGFEVVSKGSYLNETSADGIQTRGANCTSVDAMMHGELKNGQKVMVVIEWKYTEFYPNDDHGKGESGLTRKNRYNSLIKDSDSPFNITVPIENFYYEPLYQLMRQTLLAWKMVENKTEEVIKADDWIHLDVIPENNLHLRYKVSAPALSHLDLESAWRSQLKHPGKYRIITPQKLLQPIIYEDSYRGLIQYLFNRYW